MRGVWRRLLKSRVVEGILRLMNATVFVPLVASLSSKVRWHSPLSHRLNRSPWSAFHAVFSPAKRATECSPGQDAWRSHRRRGRVGRNHKWTAEQRGYSWSGGRPRPHHAAVCMACSSIRRKHIAGCFGLEKAPACWLPNDSTDGWGRCTAPRHKYLVVLHKFSVRHSNSMQGQRPAGLPSPAQRAG